MAEDILCLMKKVLVINASPRKQGNVSQMLHVITEELTGAGAEVGVEYANHWQVRPCMGCMACRSSHHCVLPPDDAQHVLTAICEADALVIGSPCYWGNIPGTLKLLFDRIVYGLMDETPRGIPIPLHKGKRCLLVSSCTTPWPLNILLHQSRGALRALREICNYSGFRIVGTVEKGGTRRSTGLSRREERKCRKLARVLLA